MTDDDAPAWALQRILEDCKGRGVLVAAALLGRTVAEAQALQTAVRHGLVFVSGSHYRITQAGVVALDSMERFRL